MILDTLTPLYIKVIHTLRSLYNISKYPSYVEL